MNVVNFAVRSQDVWRRLRTFGNVCGRNDAPKETFARFQLAAIIDSSDLAARLAGWVGWPAGLAGWLACWLTTGCWLGGW